MNLLNKVYFATGNKGKFESIKKDLAFYNIELYHCPYTFKKELDSPKLSEIASDKVIKAYSQIKKEIICVDAGFYIHSLNGFPRHKVNPALKNYGIEGILELVKGKKRDCEFRQCLAYMGPNIEYPKIFESITRGSISYEKKGTIENKPYLWSELGLIFIPSGFSQTLAEMSYENYISWRKSREKLL